MATTKNIYVTGSGLRATVSTPVINVAYQNTGIATSVTQYGVQITQPPDTEINVGGSGIGGGPAPDRSTVVGEGVTYSILFTFPRIDITGHTAHAGDTYKAFQIGKGFSETQIVSEQLAKYLSTNKLDTARNTDYFSKSIGKKFVDTLANTEQIKLTANKGAVDTVTKADSAKISAEKIFFEQKYTSERITVVANFKRQFVDLVDATDDFYGIANLDDDQIASVGKGLVDYNTLIDIPRISIESAKADQIVNSDTNYLRTDKVVVDTVNKSELLTINTQKSLIELKTLTDTAQISAEKGLLDTSVNTDQSKITLTKPFTETKIIAEQAQVDISKIATDSIVNQDTFLSSWQARREVLEQLANLDTSSIAITAAKAEQVSAMDVIKLALGRLVYFADSIGHSDSSYTQVSYNRLFEELVDATDDFYGIANLDDDQIAQVIKGIVDYASTSDRISFAGTKTLLTQYTVPDATSITSTKQLSDTFTKSDLVSLNSSKVLIDVSETTDSARTNSGKYTVDNVLKLDILSSLVYSVQADLTATNDSIKSFNVSKNTVDYSNTIDTISFNAKSTRTDTATTQNPIALNNTKQLLDTSTNTDIKYFQVNKAPIDLLAIKNADILSKDSAKVLGDVSINTDTPAYTFSTPKSDSIGVSETKIQLVTSYYRTYLDSVDATDDFYGAANVDDDQTARLGKNVVDYSNTFDSKSAYLTTVRNDTATNTDTPYKQSKKTATDSTTTSEVFFYDKITNKPLIDLGNVGDSVYINWQDYCEPNIFEPTYVGQEQFLSYN